MRTRNRSTQLSYPSTEISIIDRLTGSPPRNDNKSNLPSNLEVMIDQVNPGYFHAEKLGLIKPVSPMSKTDIKTELIFGTSSFEADLNVGYWAPDWRPYWKVNSTGLFSQFDDTLFNRPALPEINKGVLLQKALASAQTNAFDALTFAAEFHKTVNAFATAASRYRTHFEKVWAQAQRNATSNSKRHDKMIDFLVEAWFEWRFGLRPILYDIEAANEMWRRLLEGEPVLSRGWASDSASAQARSSTRLSGFHIAGFAEQTGLGKAHFETAHTNTEIARTWTTTVEGRAAVGVNVTTRGLTLADPVLTLWELTPMSVFIDYFISVGDMLAAFSPAATGDFVFATFTRTTTHELVETARWSASSGSDIRWSGSSTPSTVIQTKVFKERSLETVSPTLALDIQLDLSKVLDLLALSWALRRKLTAISRILTRR